MGQQQSKRISSASTASLLSPYVSSPSSVNTPSNPTSPISPSDPDTPLSDITTPAAPRQLTRISEILDPRDVLRQEKYLESPSRTRASQSLTLSNASKSRIVHSPSGNALGAEEFIAHPSRPLAMWERQERVLQATREGMERLEAESRAGMRNQLGRGQDENGRGGKGKRRWWCCGL